jgi:site-specific DNA recombinase
VLTAMANKASRDTSRRVSRALEDRATAGKPTAGGIRAYGFHRDGSIIPDEATVIERIASEIVEGQTLGTIAAALNDDNVPTVSGVPWQGPSVRRVVTKPRTAGLLEQRGEIIGQTEHGGILTPRQREDVMTALDSRSTGTNQLRFWLTGVLVCGRCDAPLTGRSRGAKRPPVYICRPPAANPEIAHRPSYHPGCGGISILAPNTEEVVASMILDYVARPDVQKELRSGVNDEAAEAARAELIADQAQLDAVALMFARKEITASEFRVMRREIAERISRWGGVVKAAQPSALRELQDTLSAPCEAFEALTPLQKQAVAGFTFRRGITVAPHGGGMRGFDASRLSAVAP